MKTMINDVRDVGIVTLDGNFNYGNRLQLYAVINIWHALGFIPHHIIYRRRLLSVAHPKRAARKLVRGTESVGDSLRSPNRAAAFERFNKNIDVRRIRTVKELDRDDYAFFSVGSDQIWNPRMACSCLGDNRLKNVFYRVADPREFQDSQAWHFLSFADRSQRIALAPSIGLERLDRAQMKWLHGGVCNFDRISVREKHGARLIKDVCGRQAVTICDPTLVLPSSVWSSLMDNRLTPDEPYILSYVLGAVTEESSLAIEAASYSGEIPVILLSDRSRPDELDAGPAEFISLIAHASHIVTDSFHASVFACLFNRPLTIVHRRGAASMFTRLQSLVEALGIENKVFRPGSFDSSMASDYDGVADAISQEREAFLTYLQECIDA